jgi:hypothetical protein
VTSQRTLERRSKKIPGLPGLGVEEGRQKAMCLGDHLHRVETPTLRLLSGSVLADATKEQRPQEHRDAKKSGQAVTEGKTQLGSHGAEVTNRRK